MNIFLENAQKIYIENNKTHHIIVNQNIYHTAPLWICFMLGCNILLNWRIRIGMQYKYINAIALLQFVKEVIQEYLMRLLLY